jgi:hypothetical protein
MHLPFCVILDYIAALKLLNALRQRLQWTWQMLSTILF